MPRSRALLQGWPIAAGKKGSGGGNPPSVTLSALSLSVTTATVGQAYSATISGKKAGSTVTLTGAGAAGLSVAGSTVSGTPTTAGVVSLVETLASATNSPRTTSTALTVAAAAAADTVPDAFGFVDVTGAALSTLYESNMITVSGINGSTSISVTGGEYSINGGAYTSASGTVVDGDTVKVRGTSSVANSTAVNVALMIGGVSDVYTITTQDAVTLSALSIAPTTATVSQFYSGTVTGKTSGSTITLTGAGAAGLSVAGSTVSGTPTTEGAINLVETLAGATNTPRTSAGVATVAAAVAAALSYRAMNFAGMEYGSHAVNDPDVQDGWNKPTDASFPYYAARGFNMVRIPYKIERCQPGGPNTALGSNAKSAAYLAELVDLGNKARAAGKVVLWDAHNYGKIYKASESWATEHYVGSAGFTAADLADFHVRFANYTGLVQATDQIDLMNEPTAGLNGNYGDLTPVTNQINWVNACISALRTAGKNNMIHVPGLAYSSAAGWVYHGTDRLAKGIVDPGNNFCIHLHQYTDQNNSGSQDNTFYGIWYGKLLRIAREDAIKYGYKLFLGEFNATYSTNSSQATVNAGRNALHEVMQELVAYPAVWIGMAGWRGGGRIDGNDITSFDPWSGGWTSPNSDLVTTDGTERDKLTIVKRYTGAKVADLIGSTIDLDLARNAYKGGALTTLLPVVRGARPAEEETGAEVAFGANVLRRTRKGVRIDPAVADDNVITQRDFNHASWIKGGSASFSNYVDPDDGQTYARLQMTGSWENHILYFVDHAPGYQSVDIKTLGSANQYLEFYTGNYSVVFNMTSDLNDHPVYPKNQWFRATAPCNLNREFSFLNRSMPTDILIRRPKINVGGSATPWVDGAYDGDVISCADALLAGIATGDFTLLIQTRDLDTTGLVLPILGGTVGGSPTALLQRNADGALSTALGGTLATGTQWVGAWGANGHEYSSRRVALSVRRSGTPRVVVGATGVASVGANQTAGTISAATLGSLGSVALGGLVERVTLYSGFRDTAAVDALTA